MNNRGDYDNTNRGVLFKAKDKKKDTSPDYTGTINVDGTEFKLSGWLKSSKAGEKFFSLSVWTPQEGGNGYTAAPKASPAKQADTNDEIPF
jgi:hypothetical protein